jgi:membrane protease YdiL (CAAX protease family)
MSDMSSNEQLAVSLAESPVPPAAPPGVNWRQVGLFLGLTFGLTWLLDLVLYRAGGLKTPGLGTILSLQMLLPATSAILLGTFVFPNSPLYYKVNRTPVRWFTYFFLLLTLLYLLASVLVILEPALNSTLATAESVLILLGLVVLVLARWRGGKEAFAAAGMAGGKWQYWLLFGLGLVLFYALQALLNVLFKMGNVVNPAVVLPQAMVRGMSNPLIWVYGVINGLLLGPILGLTITFGEEYGWRGYLQTELIRLGRIKGVFLVGVIWGVWHAPVILMGYNYPDQPVLGVLLMTVFCIFLAFYLAYAMFKSQGFWTAVYLHGLNNGIASFFFVLVVAPVSRAFSFGIGIPGLVCMLAAVLLILRDPLWWEQAALAPVESPAVESPE